MNALRHLAAAACAVAVFAAHDARPADAADMPRIYEIPDAYQPSGFYAGLFAGWGWGDSIITNIDPKVDGFTGGALVGWELRRDGMVAGVEADVALTTVDGVNAPAGTTADVKWLASLRARLGFDGGLYTVYGTAGVAFARMEASVAALVPPSASATLTGLAVGAGVEAMLTEGLAGRLEYIYYVFDDRDFDIGPVGVQADLRLHTVRAALIYKFSM